MSDKLEFILSRCKCSVTLTVNDHRDMHQTAAEYIAERNDQEIGEISPELGARMIAADTIVELHFYPDTPIGFYHVYGATLDEALTKGVEILQEARP